VFARPTPLWAKLWIAAIASCYLLLPPLVMLWAG